MNQPAPLIPDDVVRHWRSELPKLRADVVDDVVHYTLVIGERGAAKVARARATDDMTELCASGLSHTTSW